MQITWSASKSHMVFVAMSPIQWVLMKTTESERTDRLWSPDQWLPPPLLKPEHQPLALHASIPVQVMMTLWHTMIHVTSLCAGVAMVTPFERWRLNLQCLCLSIINTHSLGRSHLSFPVQHNDNVLKACFEVKPHYSMRNPFPLLDVYAFALFVRVVCGTVCVIDWDGLYDSWAFFVCWLCSLAVLRCGYRKNSVNE